MTTADSTPRRAVKGCAKAAAALLTGVAAFQVALAAGLPWGRAAWGGGQANLGPGLRVASGGSAVLLSGAALVVLRRAGHPVWAPLPQRRLPAAVWVLAAYAALGTVLNAVSRSPVERAVMTPVALSLAVLCACVARWAAPEPVSRVGRGGWTARPARRP